MSEDSFDEHLANEDDFELRSRAKKRRVAVGIASAVANIASSIVSFAGRSFNYGGGRKSGAKTIKCDRVDIDKQIHQLDDRHFRRKYRMDKDSFYQPLDIISRIISVALQEANADKFCLEIIIIIIISNVNDNNTV